METEAGTAQGDKLFKLAADDSTTIGGMGSSVAIDGNTVILGAPRARVNRVRTGAAYIFDTVTGDQRHKLTSANSTIRRNGEAAFWKRNVVKDSWGSRPRLYDVVPAGLDSATSKSAKRRTSVLPRLRFALTNNPP